MWPSHMTERGHSHGRRDAREFRAVLADGSTSTSARRGTAPAGARRPAASRRPTPPRRAAAPAGRRARGRGPTPAARRRCRRRCAGTARRRARARRAGSRGRRRRPRSTGPRPFSAPCSVTRTRPPGRPWRAAFSTRLSSMIRRPGSQPRQATGSGGASAAIVASRVARGGGADARVDELGEVDVGALERRRVAARKRLQAVEQLDEPPLLGERLARELAALVGGHVGMAGDRRQRRLHARQRRAQLVAGVGGEPARRVERAVAVLGRAAEAREHRVEAPGERAQLGRAAHRDRALEVALALDARRRGAQPPQRPQHDVGREPHARRGDEQHRRAEQREPPAQRGLARLEVGEARRDLEADEPAEPGIAERLGVRAVARAADRGRCRSRAAGAGAPAARCPSRAARCRRSASRSELRVARSTASRRRSTSGSPCCTAVTAVARDSSAVRRRRSSRTRRSERSTSRATTTPATSRTAARTVTIPSVSRPRTPRRPITRAGRTRRRAPCAARAARRRPRACGAGSRRRRRSRSCPDRRCSARSPRAGGGGRAPRRDGA